jgi:energy-coupling factor transporter ATP-binding protein EcfA2
MFNITKLEEIVNDQRDNFQKKDSGIERLINFDKYIKTKQIVILSGVRRSGKSTLLKQFSEKLNGDFYYINFDDERLIDFSVSDFDRLLTVWKKSHQSKNILIDEIQNVEKWERFIRRIYEEGYKIFITGSNAKLLSSELSTHLTGRYFKIEVYPFSFKEYLIFNDIEFDKVSSSNRIKVIKAFDNYLVSGGFPDFIKYKDEEFLKRTYEDIIYKDIITRFGVKEVVAFRKVSSFVFSNFTKRISYKKIAFDGDGDRVFFVDEKGELISSDLIIALIAKLIDKKVLYDLRCSNIIKETARDSVMWRVGHSFIKKKMKDEDIFFGGEYSGHYYLKQGSSYYESPYFVIYKLFEAMENKKLSELIAPFKKYYHSGELNFEVEDKQSVIEKVEKNYSYGKITKIDGVRIDFDDWWFLLRGSNTEPILRLIVEAKSKELLDSKIKEIVPFFS